MSFQLGNFSVDEVLYGVAQDSSENILYTLDQLSTASVEISAESTDITDKKGNVVRTVYTSKTGTFNATNAFLHPQIMNAASGSKIQTASTGAPIEMPKISVVEAGKAISIEGAKKGTIKVIGLYGNGANAEAMTDTAVQALITGTAGDNGAYPADSKITVPAGGTDLPIQYLVKYDRDVEEGIRLVNDAESFPDLVKLTLFVSIVDPCSDSLRSAYVVLPRFMSDPSVTISLDRDSQEMDFNGNLNIDYCSTTKALYYIYFPGNEEVITGTVA